MEEQFYFLLPALALGIAMLRKSLLWAWLAVAGALLAGMAVRSHLWSGMSEADLGSGQYYTQIYYASWCRFDELICGVALALLKNYHSAVWTRITAYGNWTLAAGVALTALSWHYLLEDHYGYAMTVYGYPLLGLSFSLLLLAALSPGSLLQRWRVPGAASVALWSYAIYLTHKQLCVLLRAPLQEQGWGPESWQALSIMGGASLLAGWLLYLLVETPFMKLRDRYVPSNYASSSQSRQTATA